CSSVNRDFFIGTTSAQGSHYHAGILFLNGAGFRVRVILDPEPEYVPCIIRNNRLQVGCLFWQPEDF
ncbi:MULTISPECIES: hypothetical protein, partial [unclassified Pantoea]|uniref:hypothetical protein n=1 Tax=unclassified Pantoea TaxID=2630326 RepID=UPI00301D0472